MRKYPSVNNNPSIVLKKYKEVYISGFCKKLIFKMTDARSGGFKGDKNEKEAAVKGKYICKKCGKSFDYQSLLTRHLNKIKSCIPEKLACRGCQKEFLTKGNLVNHVKNCKLARDKKWEEEIGPVDTIEKALSLSLQTAKLFKETSIELKSVEAKLENMAQINTKLTEQNKLLIDIIKDKILPRLEENGECKSVVEGLNYASPQQNQGHHNTMNNTVNNITININSWDNPTYDHLKNPEFIAEMVKNSMNAIVFLVEPLWFNEKCPENISIHSVNKKTGEFLVRENGSWVSKASKDISPKMREILTACANSLSEDIPDHMQKFHGDFKNRLHSLYNRDTVQETLNVRKEDESRIVSEVSRLKKVSKPHVK